MTSALTPLKAMDEVQSQLGCPAGGTMAVLLILYSYRAFSL